MQKIRHIGGSDTRILSEDDMLAIGVEDHPGLAWTVDQPVIEVEDDLAEVLMNSNIRAVLRLEPSDEEIVEELVEEKSKEELAEEAKLLGITGTSKMNKDELAEAIVAKQAETDASGVEGDQLEPHS
jgi:hypothetical protein